VFVADYKVAASTILRRSSWMFCIFSDARHPKVARRFENSAGNPHPALMQEILWKRATRYYLADLVGENLHKILSFLLSAQAEKKEREKDRISNETEQ